MNFILKYALMFCYYNKQLLSALGLVLNEFDANKKVTGFCQVSDRSCEPNNQLNVCTTSATEGEVGPVKLV